MAMRLGEMVLIIRTQDFASRNLDRVSANLGRLSKMQQLQRRQVTQQLREARIIGRMDTAKADLSNLQRRLALENQLTQAQKNRSVLSNRLAATSAQAQLGALPSGIMKGNAPTRIKQLTASLALMDRELKIVQSDLAITGEALNKVRFEKLHRAGQTVSRLGRVFQLVGLIGVGSFAALGNAASNFTASVSVAATQARNFGERTSGVVEKSKKLQEAILKQMQRFPVSASEMSGAAYEIFSSLDLTNNGIVNFAKGIHILELANKSAVAGQVSLDESMQGIIITLNNFDPSLQNVRGTLDTLFDIVRFGNIHFSDLTTILSKVAPAAKAVGFNLEDVSGILSQLTRTLPTGTVAAGFSQLLGAFSDRNFQEGIRVLSKAKLGKALDITVDGNKLKKPLEVIKDILTVFPELAKGGLETRRFFKLVTSAGREALTGRVTEGREFTIQIRRVFEGIVQNFGSVQELQRAVLNNNHELEQSFQAMLKDPGVQWQIFLSRMQAFALLVGTAALPALLKLADGLERVVNWFRNLDPATQSLIVKIGVFGSAGLLLLGVLGSIVGSVATLAGTLGILGGKLPILLSLARGLAFMAGIGAIAIILKTAWTGDASAQDFLLGAMAGATAGSIFGPAGAVIGGITVPVIMQFMKTRPKKPVEKAFDEFQKQLGGNPSALDALKSGDIVNPWGKYWKDAGVSMKLGREEFEKQWAILVAKAKGKLPPNIMTAISPEVTKLFAKYKKDIVGLKKPTESWGDSIRRSLKAAGDKTALELFDKMLKTNQQLEKMFGEGAKNASQNAAGMANAIASGIETGEQRIDQAVQNLHQIFDQFRQENVSAFGQLFQGPFFQSETWSLAQEWDVKPTIRDINKDLQGQITSFKKWRNTLASISKKKGVPSDMIKELRALGPDAMPYLEAINRAAPQQLNKFTNMWRQKQKMIEDATKIDFDKQLKQWMKFGSDIALNIILGLQSEDGALDKAFRQYITSKFPNIIAQAKAEAVAQWKRDQAARGNNVGGNKPGTTKPPASTTNTNSNNQTTIIVHPASGETTLHALRRGAWEFKNGGGHRGKKVPPKNATILVDPPGPHGANPNNPYTGPRH